MVDGSTQLRQRGRPRGSDRAEVVAIARELFLAQGYSGTTMDAVAARARVSKQSLYREFASKEVLYSAIVSDWVDRGRDAMRPHVAALLDAAQTGEGLFCLARALQAGILSTPVLQMRTLIAAEAARFPEVAANYISRSWDRNLQILAEAFGALDLRKSLAISDTRLAAEQFTWLVLAAPLNRLTLSAGARPYDDDELDLIAREAVVTFLQRFGGATLEG
jgi:TetR/AcrR family transcriptional regulator, mexJK operon transcriptional repressor